MATIEIEGLCKSFAGKQGVKAVDDLDLAIDDGELLVVLGPSGCGKTTTLRCVAGLEEPDGGRIVVGGRALYDRAAKVSVAPAKRDLGMVFQSYALWPHKTVRGNIAYPLRARRMREALAEGWVEEAADLVDCRGLLDRYPSQLSGGQQQRVALARGLVGRPAVVLFDEPLSNLDAKLRDQVRGELHALHRRLRFTGMYVTHDQQEALAIGNRLAVMREGRVEQAGTPREVFEQPATEYVADFIGYGNRIALAWAGDRWSSSAGSPGGIVPVHDAEDSLVVRTRPEDLRVVPADAAPEGLFVVRDLTVLDASFAGRRLDVLVQTGGTVLRATVPTGNVEPPLLEAGASVAVAVQPGLARVFDDTGAARSTEWAPGPSADAVGAAAR